MRDFDLDEIRYQVALYSTAIVPTDDIFIDNRFEQHKTEFGHYESYYRLFYRLAEYLKPNLTVELGTWQATAAAHFASGWPNGTVITIDHHSDPGDDKNKELALEAQKQYNNLIYLQGWTWDRVDVVRNFGTRIDILFIDSWHQYEYAMKDWNLYSPLLANPALVICDDILKGDGPAIGGMDRFWNELPGRSAGSRTEKFLDETLRNGIPMGFLKWLK
jgi:predicted O-methyltransferase YrrM